MTAIIECRPRVADNDVVLVTGASTGFGRLISVGGTPGSSHPGQQCLKC